MRRFIFRVRYCGVLAMCCFIFVFTSIGSLYFGQKKEYDRFEVDMFKEEEETAAPMRMNTMNEKRVEAVNMSSLDSHLNFTARKDVETKTAWNAPIMWEGMFDGKLYDQKHKRVNSSVALTVFAVGRYLEAYLKNFLVSAEKHFMIGLPVTYYVFTDTPEDVPEFELGPQRTMKVLQVERHSRWQDISMMRMKTISEIIESEISYQFPYIFCLDVDQIFEERFGSEALGESVTVLHSYFYNLPKEKYSYDKNPKSKAYMEKGDYYYHAALFGGTWQNVKSLVDFCYAGIVEDKKNNVEALWHDESHLNKYFLLNKPSKLLSPEYCWDKISLKIRPEIKIMRLLWAEKRYDVLRT